MFAEKGYKECICLKGKPVVDLWTICEFGGIRMDNTAGNIVHHKR